MVILGGMRAHSKGIIAGMLNNALKIGNLQCAYAFNHLKF